MDGDTDSNCCDGQQFFVLKKQAPTSSSSSSSSSPSSPSPSSSTTTTTALFPDLSYLETFYFQNIIYKIFSFNEEHGRTYLQSFRRKHNKQVHFNSFKRKRRQEESLTPGEDDNNRQEILELELKGLNKITAEVLDASSVNMSIPIYDYLYNHRHLAIMTQHFSAFYFEIYQNIVDLLLTVEECSPYTQKVLTFLTNMFHTSSDAMKEFLGRRCTGTRTHATQNSWVMYKIILYPSSKKVVRVL